MTFRGYSPLAVLSGLCVLVSVASSVWAFNSGSWLLMAHAGVVAVLAVALAVLSVLDS